MPEWIQWLGGATGVFVISLFLTKTKYVEIPFWKLSTWITKVFYSIDIPVISGKAEEKFKHTVWSTIPRICRAISKGSQLLGLGDGVHIGDNDPKPK